MKRYLVQTNRIISDSLLFRTLLLLSGIWISACDKQLNSDSPVNENLGYRHARLAGKPLLSLSYEIETFSLDRIKSENKKSREFAFGEIAARPRLERQRIRFSLFADGEYEMETIPLVPEKIDLLPEPYRKQLEESVLPDRIVTKNGAVIMYDKEGNQTGSYTLKSSRFTELATRIIRDGSFSKERLSAEFTGNPLINSESILNIAKEKDAEIQSSNGLTQIKFDLARFAGEARETGESLSGKYTIQYYDFQKNRFLGEKLYDKEKNQLLYQSSLFYDKAEDGNQLRRVFSESHDVNPKTGVETTKIKQIFYDNMQVMYNL